MASRSLPFGVVGREHRCVGEHAPSRRLVPADELVSTFEIAERFGVSQQAVMSWYRRRHLHQTPEPGARVGRGGVYRLWLWSDWERWGWKHDLLQNAHVDSPPSRPDDRLIRAAEVSRLLKWKSSGTPREMHKRGNFPDPVVIADVWFWWESEVLGWAATAQRRPGRRKASPAS